MRVMTFYLAQVPVDQRVYNAIHWINHYPVDRVVCFINTHPLDSDLSGGQHYPAFEQLIPGCLFAFGTQRVGIFWRRALARDSVPLSVTFLPDKGH